MFRIMMLASGLLLQAMTGYAQQGSLKKIPINTVEANPKGYIEYLPQGFVADGSRKYAVLYWLHGLDDFGGGTSTSLDKILNVQVAQWLKTHDTDFIVLVPQDQSGYWNGVGNSIGDFITWANRHYGNAIEPGQQHLAGLSAGGYAIRDLMTSTVPATVALYKSFSTFTLMSTNLAAAFSKVRQIVDNNQYVWFHHGDKDVEPNLVANVRIFHDALYKLDAERSRLTVYKNLGHEAWDCVYNGKGMTTEQITVSPGTAPYYNWTSGDPDGDWFTWMKARGKTPLNATVPTVMNLSSLQVSGKLAAGSTVGVITCNGAKPVTFTVVSGAGDGQGFRVTGNKLLLAADTKAGTYTITIEAKNAAGTFRKEFTILAVAGNVVGVENGKDGYGYRLYPNPVRGDEVYVVSAQSRMQIDAAEVISMTGARYSLSVAAEPGQETTWAIALTGVPAGAYILRLLQKGLTIQQQRLIRY